MLLTDSHCHFDFAAFGGSNQQVRAQHWQQAKVQGVHRLVIPGVEPAQWSRLPKLCRTHAGLYYALGLHPWWLAAAPENWQGLLAASLARAHTDKHCVAVGEIGLDKQLSLPLEQQEAAFIAQLKLAGDYQLPVILHSVGMHDRVLKWLRRYPVVGGVVHGFSGSAQQAQAFWKLGIYIGVGGTITYERATKTRHAIASLPLAALVLETDAPDMPLFGFQGQNNHPYQLPLVLSALATLRQDDEAQLAIQLEYNVSQLFDFVNNKF